MGALLVSILVPARTGRAGATGARPRPAASPSPPAGGLGPGTQFTPLTASVISPPMPVKETDGVYHLVYELLLINATSQRTRIDRVEVSDSRTGRVLLSLTGSALVSDMNPIGSPAGTPTGISAESFLAGRAGTSPAGITMDGSARWVIWLDVRLTPMADVPASLDQRVAGSILAGKGGKGFPFSDVLARMPTGLTAPVVLGPHQPGQPARYAITYPVAVV
jgi:hypothetical protein